MVLPLNVNFESTLMMKKKNKVFMCNFVQGSNYIILCKDTIILRYNKFLHILYMNHFIL